MIIELSQEQESLFEYIEQSQSNVFVTGRAGTGKSTLLSHLTANTEKSFAVCAPTGVAALNVGGVTIHSLFTFPLGLLGEVEIARHLSKRTREILRALDMLVIDEVSMVSADLMDAIDRALRIARGRKNEPFGGAQVVMFGDPYQLAPVPPRDPQEKTYIAENYQSLWFFDAHVWRQSDLERFELSEIFRQSDDDFKEILNAIRDGSVTQAMLDSLNQAGNRYPPHSDVIRLATINETVNSVNHQRMGLIETEPKVFKAVYSASAEKSFGRALPAEIELSLKVGAQVMFIKNDDASTSKTGGTIRRWVNGTIGRVVALPKSGLVVVDVDGEELEVGPATWEKVRYEIEEDFDESTGKTKEVLVPVTLAEFKQIPLRLAWAVTIHKSQGQTYDEVQIDMGRGAFSPGQTYVALSRVRTLTGLYLTRAVLIRDVMVDKDVIRFMSGAEPLATSSEPQPPF
ncbi:AAA family ATPase [Aquiluna sp.]|nr:AAA family ATPase [Aquiluna sp.]MDA7761264.1 AAA family ATPase [Aquiluna sp.]MDA7799311.1 AAA family ATPase [Aquiluna sp.]MDA8927362.1 AAA family ATPase [Aquiluna sp.]MDB4018671.1 AAA family ATPase [Aquiluna sp.]